MVDTVYRAEPSAKLPQRHLVFPDPIAFKFLENDPCVEVIHRRSVLRGYDLYLVEQWACSRRPPTLVIATYTGNEKDSIVVGVLAVPADESLLSEEVRLYLKKTEQNHARPKNTELGELMVTNLSSFPSSLTVIAVPEGDLRQYRNLFIVNEDLKRLGCSGRSGLTLTEPTEATQSKFQQLYRINDRVPLKEAVVELVKLCQVALYMFDKLDHAYIDGLLCDVTERAISNWWTEVGAEHYNYEPTDGILGPSTVAALLGMLMGARNRLHWQGAPVPKDVFDLEGTKRGISYFQKAVKLERTRRLDQQTLFKLHTATTKAAMKEDWGVQKAIKSTVTEIGGKRGEIVIDMVSGKDKAGLADIETVDIDKFASLVYGERPRWLWHGKPRRTPVGQAEHDDDPGPVSPLPKAEAASQPGKRTHSLPVEDDLEMKRKDELLAPDTGTAIRPTMSMMEGPTERDALHKTVFKSVAGKMSDARSGFGRFKEAVGARGRGHGTRLSISTKEDVLENGNGAANGYQNPSIPPSPAAVVSRAFTWNRKPEEYLSAIRRGDPDALPGLAAVSSPSSTADLKAARLSEYERRPRESDRSLDILSPDMLKLSHQRTTSAVPSSIAESDVEAICPHIRERSNLRQLALSRRHSCDIGQVCTARVLNEDRWARRMSFGDAEEAVLTWDELVDLMDETEDEDDAEARAVNARHLAQCIEGIVYGIEPWVKDKIKLLQLLDDKYGRDKVEIQNLHHHFSEIYHRVKYNSDGMLAEERASLTESVKEIEVLVARLDYEINALVQKINDVEDGIQNFERQVEDVERRAEELKKQLETESWLHWFVRTLTGVGTGPHITRSESHNGSH
ncbi:hypothetical protein BBK36DRAFT_1114469 [Trichoderma citrinoviride]|uniref:STB6-like N-terminal domain-containing protein n=1 Tax=Trichoderma citrinoviride TaxID=58853 RepID=A0A2T4BG67_9HYPO|nr:hypothetical protein BBK36DRAFT_1114469 [Trichoderma citrinoviride]PTB68219.1 hypothetical protein BBK36DRAFT_1114469 [Trichoderma citrinoviride]